MDNVTHTFTGLMLARIGLDRWCPRAAALLMLASNAPDIDIVMRFKDSITYLDYHRHLTHSLAFAPAVAILPVLVVRLFSRGPFPYLRSMLLSLLGVLVHLGFDAANMYGVRLALPFSAKWYELDAISIVDPWILLVLFLGVSAPAIAKLVNAEIGSKGGPGRGWAAFALIFISLYTGARVMLHQRAIATLDARMYLGADPKRVAAWPTPYNPFRWTGYAEGANFQIIHDLNLNDEFDPLAGRVFYRPENLAALGAARKTETMDRFLRFAQYPIWRITPLAEPQGALQVEAADLRFGQPPNLRFIVTVVLDQSLRVMSEEFRYGIQPLGGPSR
jgi:membrane-bound metal-dependent hydrolase YbcI (DUF457 family)